MAGISMGGGGAMKYASEYPGMFGYEASFSGELDIELPVAQNFQPKTCVEGNPARHEVLWRDYDPTDLAGNLRGVRLFVRCGDGTPGPFDPPKAPANPGAAYVYSLQRIIEFGAHLEARAFLAALAKAGVRGVDVRFFHGTHSAPYWTRDLRQFAGWLRVQLCHPPTALVAFSVTSAHQTFSAWGWNFVAHRGAREFVYLRVDRGRVIATGSGRLGVVTPPGYHPGGSYLVLVRGRGRHVRADSGGRLAFTVDLGPSHRHQQTVFGAGATRGWTTRSVQIVTGSVSRS